ncbi:MAG TPA: hypothetical protein PKZ76_17975 [Xanthomonadaceae bacterium]|nr:hypothetical protein [Xanthomonadaceae bacterium]
MDNPQWWVATIGDTLIWARLTELPTGTAQVFDCDGRTLPYADAAEARAALMDAEFRALDGLDEEDAAAMGFDLASTEPPSADSEEALHASMTQKLPRRQ